MSVQLSWAAVPGHSFLQSSVCSILGVCVWQVVSPGRLAKGSLCDMVCEVIKSRILFHGLLSLHHRLLSSRVASWIPALTRSAAPFHQAFISRPLCVLWCRSVPISELDQPLLAHLPGEHVPEAVPTHPPSRPRVSGVIATKSGCRYSSAIVHRGMALSGVTSVAQSIVDTSASLGYVTSPGGLCQC